MVNSLLSKVCSICGLAKSLSAFLITGDKGAIYGNICASCRAMQKKASKDATGSTTSTTGKTITSKEKAESDLVKEKEKSKVEKEYYQERGEKDKKQTLQMQQKENVLFEEKKRRESSFSFLTTKTDIERKADKQQAMENAQAQTAFEKTTSERKEATTLQETQTNEATKQHEAQTNIDTTSQYLTSPTGAQEKFTKGVGFATLRQLLSGYAPMASMGQKTPPMVKHAQEAAKKIDPNNTLQNEDDEEKILDASFPRPPRSRF